MIVTSLTNFSVNYCFRPAVWGVSCSIILLAIDCTALGQLPTGKTGSLSDQTTASTVVKYGDFGAKGDGKADDFEALSKAHQYANLHGLPVKADDGAAYYIGGSDKTIIIQTNTDFRNARFIIDDTDLKKRSANVFQVQSLLRSFKPKGIKSLKRNQTRIDTEFPGACIIAFTNSNVKHFIRLGKNQNSGTSQTDVCLVDEKGNIDPKTPVIWDFDQVTDVLARPVDEATLFIKGGKFTTIANASDGTEYHARGISVIRSKVVIDGLEHRVEGEGEVGAPYYGFINISGCANVMVRNSILTGHQTYSKIGSAGKRVAMGSYDITVTRALNVSFVNCSQTNDIMDAKYWGIIGTNFCKNITYDGCTFSRFDAHQGVTNATIRNSTLGYMGIRLTGTGTFLMENTTVQARNLISLREDYGSTWNGDFIIRDCTFAPLGGTPSIFGGSNDGQHDFGYTCHMPARILIDKLHIADSKNPKDGKGPTIFQNFNPRLTDSSFKQPYPYVITREIICKDITTEGGKPLRISDNPFMFRDVKISGLDAE